MRTLLITGFEPFGGEAINPSWEAVAQLPAVLGPWRLEKRRIPVVFGLAAQTVLEEAQRLQAAAIVCVGQAGGRALVTPELVGINLRYASIPDNAGQQPQDSPIDPNGQAACFSTLPVRAMAQAAGGRCAVSYSAGAYVCNDLLYSLLWRRPQTPACFVHVPYLPEQAAQGVPSMPLAEIVSTLRALLEAIPEAL